jgi:hypothetical protein
MQVIHITLFTCAVSGAIGKKVGQDVLIKSGSFLRAGERCQKSGCGVSLQVYDAMILLCSNRLE